MAARRQRAKDRALEARRELYRQLILEGGQRVFAERGYDDAKMEEIAQESGLSLGTLYSVFAGKAKIFAAIHEAADEEILRRSIACVDEGMTSLDATLAGVRAWVEYFLEHPDFLRMHLREGQAWSEPSAGRGRERSRAWKEGLAMLERGVARCVADGSFVAGEPGLIARTMIAMQQVQLAWWLERDMERAHEDVVEEVLEQVRRCFATESAS